MTGLRQLPLRFKVALAIGCVFAAALIVSAAGLLLYQSFTYRARAQNDLSRMAEAVAIGLNGPISTLYLRLNSEVALSESLAALERLRTGSDITEVHVYRISDSATVTNGLEHFVSWPAITPRPDNLPQGFSFQPDCIWLVTDLKDERGNRFAVAALRSDMTTLREERAQALTLLGIVMAGCAVVCILVGTLLQRALSRPISALASTVHQITERGDHTLRAQQLSEDEIGALAKDFNRMLDTLESQADALRTSEANYREIFDSTTDALLIHDRAGRILDVNQATCRLFGYDRATACTLAINQLSLGQPPYSGAEAGVWVQHAISDGPQLFEWQSRRRDGTLFWSEVGLRACTIGGEPRVIASVRDITERKQAQQAVERMNEELEQRVAQRTAQLEAANRELESFSYSVSHDLRAPLRAIDGYTRILQEDYSPAFDDEGRRVCNQVCASAHRMGQLIDDLLNFARVGRVAIDPLPIDMNQLVESVYREVEGTGNHSTAQFRRGDLPGAIADPNLLRQVWANLLGNALKYSSKRHPPVIEVLGRVDNGQACYSVRDNGAGFDMRYVDKLFGVFHRLHTEREFSGTGVGLAIVQRIVQRHGGRIWAEGLPDRGATFTFTLPASTH